MRWTEKWNEDWKFVKKNVGYQNAATAVGENIQLPHTWNAIDGQDGGNDYYRGTCYYVKTFSIPQLVSNEQVYLEFRGANASTTVYVNDKVLTSHDGGYSTFRVNMTDVIEDENVIVVAVNNSKNNYVYPQRADFTFYGGIYRDVYLLIVSEAHFDLDNYGEIGIKVTPEVIKDYALVTIETSVTNRADSVQIVIENVGEVLCDIEEGKAIGTLKIDNVHLWKGIEDPHLYTATANLLIDGRPVDTVSTRFGCRTFSFDNEQGFFLNGKAYPLRGVSRHQDRKDVGNALTTTMQKEDLSIILEMGANTIRLAHYQHDQYFYDLCDQYGMIVWAEIPYITEHLPEGRSNTLSQLRELIGQCYNHPSIVCWGLSNEISVAGITDDLIENHRLLNDLAHHLDWTRPTAMAHVFMLEIDHPLASLPDISSYNLYYGWYVGALMDNDEWFDTFHKQYPDRVIGLSEYGADSCLKWQTSNPEVSDYTEQYQCSYHEHLLETIMHRPYIWATHCWNMFDFGADGRDEGGEHGINQKGLVTFDRKIKKDAYYLYKAYLSDQPFVHICGSRYIDRTEWNTEIKVYTNQKSVDLYNNGKLIAQKAGERIFVFEVAINDQHTIEVKSGGLIDKIKIRKVLLPNKDYIFEEGSIRNWFDEPGMEVRVGCFSILDSIGDICQVPQGVAIIEQIMKVAKAARGDVAQNVKPNAAMESMMNRMSVEALIKRAAGAISQEMVVQLNQALNQIQKP